MVLLVAKRNTQWSWLKKNKFFAVLVLYTTTLDYEVKLQNVSFRSRLFSASGSNISTDNIAYIVYLQYNNPNNLYVLRTCTKMMICVRYNECTVNKILRNLHSVDYRVGRDRTFRSN